MSKLNAAKRNALPDSAFAGPGRSFPLNDASHARAALSGVTRAEHAGNISKATGDRIKAKADRKLGFSQAQPAHTDPRRPTAMRTA